MTQQTIPIRVSGKCKTWAKGYGFITRDDGQGDVFVHYEQILKSGFKSLTIGQPVEFEVGVKPNGNTCALRVTGEDVRSNIGILYGKCKTWVGVKGFGFVTRLDGGGDIFVHQSQVRKGKGYRSLVIDELVQFQIETKPDGKVHAIDVKSVNLVNTVSRASEEYVLPNTELKGTCKAWNNGFGFITRNDGGPDVFVHQTEIQKSGFRSLKLGEPVEFKLERRDDGSIHAVKVKSSLSPAIAHLPQLPTNLPQLPKVMLPPQSDLSAQFHPQQMLLNHYPIIYKPEQLPLHPLIPEGTKDNWKKMMQWAQPGFYSCYSAQGYQSGGNYWGGIPLASVAKRTR